MVGFQTPLIFLANFPGPNPKHEYHVIHTLRWSVHLTIIAIIFDVMSEIVSYDKTRIKCNIETEHCPINQASKVTVN